MQKYLDDKKFMQIKCGTLNKSMQKCPAYLGYLQIDTPNTAIYYCKNCHINHIYTVDIDGTITKDISTSKRNIGTVDSIAIFA